MDTNINLNKKGDSLGFELLGGSEKGEAKYRTEKEMSKEAQERTAEWAKKQKIKLGLGRWATFASTKG